MPRVLVVGAGSWGTALAITLTRNPDNEVFLQGRDPATMRAMAQARCNTRYLPEITLPDSLHLVMARTPPGNIETLVAAVPFQTLREVLRRLARDLPGLACVACACKGLENDTHRRADEIVAEIFPPETVFAMLSGPNFALEVAQGLPAAITIATRDRQRGLDLVGRFHSPSFRPYLTDDVIGVQIGGAIKNVIAIAAGIGDGLGLGANSRAALITRGLAEITRFGVAQGGELETFMGLSGLGDLILTCTDDQSRNRRFGLRLGAGVSVEDAIAEVGLVEGVATAAALAERARELELDMPISFEVDAAIAGRTTPAQAVKNLLSRDPVAESLGLGAG